MMQEWSAEQVTKITQELINLEFLPTATNVDRGVLNQEFVLQQMDTALMALTSYEASDTVTNSRKNPLEAWRRLQKRYDPTSGGRKRHLFRAIISLGRCSLSELQAGIERWESYLSRVEKKLKAMAVKGGRESHGPRLLAKERKVRETANRKANPKVPRVPKVRKR